MTLITLIRLLQNAEFFPTSESVGTWFENEVLMSLNEDVSHTLNRSAELCDYFSQIGKLRRLQYSKPLPRYRIIVGTRHKALPSIEHF